MESSLLEVVGKAAGIGGIGLGVFLLLFRNLIRKLVFPQLTSAQAFHIIKMMMWFIFSIAFAGIIAWVASEYLRRQEQRVKQPAAAPEFSPLLDEKRNLLITNTGGAAFNVERELSSRIKYAVAVSSVENDGSLVRRLYTQREPGINDGGGSLGGDSSWFPINYTLFAAVNDQFCIYVKNGNFIFKNSSLTFELDALIKYDDTHGQQHRRAWKLHLTGSCPPGFPNEIAIREANASEFKRNLTCQNKFDWPIAAATIKKVMLDTIEAKADC